MNPLIRIIPASLVRFFAKPYVAGDSLEKAMEAVRRLREERGLLLIRGRLRGELGHVFR